MQFNSSVVCDEGGNIGPETEATHQSPVTQGFETEATDEATDPVDDAEEAGQSVNKIHTRVSSFFT